MGGAKRHPSPLRTGIDGYRFAPPILLRYTFAVSRRVAPEVCWKFTLENQRAQGMPGARCTRGLACKVEGNAHEHTGSAEAIRHSLRKEVN